MHVTLYNAWRRGERHIPPVPPPLPYARMNSARVMPTSPAIPGTEYRLPTNSRYGRMIRPYLVLAEVVASDTPKVDPPADCSCWQRGGRPHRRVCPATRR